MTNQEFYEFRTNVEGSAVSYENQPDGTTIVTCQDGSLIRVNQDGDSRVVESPIEGNIIAPIRVIKTTPGGDSYIYDRTEQRASDILSSAEEQALASGEMNINDIICDNDGPEIESDSTLVFDRATGKLVTESKIEDGLMGVIAEIVAVAGSQQRAAELLASDKVRRAIQAIIEAPDAE